MHDRQSRPHPATIYGQTNQTYTVGYTYGLSGHVTLMSYPSGHVVNYNYDNAGRLADRDSNNLAFTGTLGDNTLRTYSRGISYAPGGQMMQERLGTTTAIYNKLFYNSRGQLAEIREGLSANNDSSERGAIINFYSDHCWGMCTPTQQNDGSMPDNNGNFLKQQIDVPGSAHFSVQWFVYDSLNRLKSANEVDYPYAGGSQERWRQTYIYDRFGNRTIDQNSANTWGDGIPKPNFSVVTASNRLAVPNGYSGTMSYDAVGNLTTDTYSSSAVTRLYDAENRMTKETQASSYVAGEYSYDGDGRRVKRKVGSVETWQVYGLGGELLAEYAANASYTTPQKEYGYRNGQLLVTVTCGSGYGDPPVLHDNPLVVGETTVQARHITELRTAINALRARAGMSAYPWTTSATTSDWISAAPIAEMRTALNQVLGPPSSGYSLGLASELPIKAIHIQELRDRVTTAWGIDIRWLVTDQLGTPRMVFDLSGSLSGVSRHDYLPFGEELYAGIGGRTISQGYSLGDGARQKFTSKERDGETGLDYFLARYYANSQGRFSSVDPKMLGTKQLMNPQRWNRYTYVLNNPLALYDPDGQDDAGGGGAKTIDIYLYVSTEMSGDDKMAKSQRAELNGLIKTAEKVGININVFEGLTDTSANAKASLSNSDVVIFGVHTQNDAVGAPTTAEGWIRPIRHRAVKELGVGPAILQFTENQNRGQAFDSAIHASVHQSHLRARDLITFKIRLPGNMLPASP